MRRTVLLMATLLTAGCLMEPLRLDLKSENTTDVCVEGDAGSCCQLMYDGPVCDGQSCKPLEHTATRCIMCGSGDLDFDAGGVRFAPPPEPTELVTVCGKASYEKYRTQ